jgi:hypothetical protein
MCLFPDLVFYFYFSEPMETNRRFARDLFCGDKCIILFHLREIRNFEKASGGLTDFSEE